MLREAGEEALLYIIVGLAVGYLVTATLIPTLQPVFKATLPPINEIAIDEAAVSFLFAAAAVLWLSLLLSADLNIAHVLRRGITTAATGAGARHTRSPLGPGLIAGQVAVAAVLLYLGLVLGRSYLRLSAEDPGFNSSDLVTAAVTPYPTKSPPRPWPHLVVFASELLARLEALGTVRAAALGSDPADGLGGIAVTVRLPAQPEVTFTGVVHSITPDYFRVIGAQLLNGREFSHTDRLPDDQLTAGVELPNDGAVVVTSSTALRLWPGDTALGKVLRLEPDRFKSRRVIGIVRPIRRGGSLDPDPIEVYVPFYDSPRLTSRLVLRTNGNAPPVTDLQAIARSLQPQAAIYDMRITSDSLQALLARPRALAAAGGLLGLVALWLAVGGVYSMMAYLAASRAKEIAIRVAVGATREDIVIGMIRSASLPVTIGGTAGILLGIALGRVFRALFFGLPAFDLVGVIGLILIIALAGTLAMAVPAWRATTREPLDSLRT